jgi:protein gp37
MKTTRQHPIAWLNPPGLTGETLNPIRARLPAELSDTQRHRVGWHCAKTAAGCAHCYAETLNRRFGTQQAYSSESLGVVTPFLDETTLLKPLSWKKPRAIFWGDMSDLFGDWVSDEWIDRCFAVMAMTPQHRHIVLTKRPWRMSSYLKSARPRIAAAQSKAWARAATGESDLLWPLPNVWLGYSASTQADLDNGVPELLRCPAVVRFLSLEPLLEAIDLRAKCPPNWQPYVRTDRIGWVIVGGESGPKARPCNLAWVRSIVKQCRAAAVPVFVKQLGARPTEPRQIILRDGEQLGDPIPAWDRRTGKDIKDPKGGDWSEWPEDLRVREFPEAKP